MKITLISLDREIMCIGVRTLSAVLKKIGYPTNILFLNQVTGKWQKDRFQVKYTEEMLGQIKEHCADADLIGVSLMSNQFTQAIQVTNYLKEHLKTPVIWGGIHPTIAPEECLDYADMVCVGEGEEAIVDVVQRINQGMDCSDIQNIYIKRSDQIVKNQVRALIQNLDELPFPDFDMEGHFFIQNNKLVLMDHNLLSGYDGERFSSSNKQEGIHYTIITSRGCPYKCTYCCNWFLRGMYKGERYLRRRSVENVIQELKHIQNTNIKISRVFILDDNFTAAKIDYLEEFRKQYKQNINLPFFCQCSPLTIDAERIMLLIDAGCFRMAMGVETGSERIAEMYNRTRFYQSVSKAMQLLENHRSGKFIPHYYFIVDNPYEETEDMLKTLQMILNIPDRTSVSIHSLMLFPGTELFHNAVDDGLIMNENDQIFKRDWFEYKNPFLRFWVKLYQSNAPKQILRYLINSSFSRLVNIKIARWTFSVLYIIVIILGKLKGRIIGFLGSFSRNIN